MDQNTNTTNNNENEVTSMRGVEANVIGSLRTEKVGRPLLVVELLVIFLVVMVSLPFITSMLEDESSFLYKIIHPGTPSSTPISQTSAVKKEFEDGSKRQPLNAQTSMKFENLILKKFYLSDGKVTMTLSSYNGILDLDEHEYYLELYSSSEQKLAAIKLTGKYDNVQKEVTLTSYGLNFNTTMSYSGKVVSMKDSDYPNVTINSDESGIGSFNCSMDGRNIEYMFKNNYLIGIKDNYEVKISEQDSSTDYLNLKRIYDEKAAKLGNVATNEEGLDGFIFSANMDLESYTIPTDVEDNSYYKLDTEAKVIHYAQKGKGFDCK